MPEPARGPTPAATARSGLVSDAGRSVQDEPTADRAGGDTTRDRRGSDPEETTMGFTPYLFFSNDECAAAFDFYHQVLGGELHVMTNADAPSDEDRMPGAPPESVMHASLELPTGSLWGSDDPTGDGGPKTGVAVAYTAPDVAEARRVFEGLAQGGEVMMPFAPTFYSAGFGGLTDKFGVQWMVDTSEQPA